MIYRWTVPFMLMGILLVALTAGCLAAENEGPPICPHILGWPDDVKEWANGAPWIKALDVSSCIIAKERGARVLYRVWDHASGPDGDPSIGGKKFGEEILERLSHFPKDKLPDAISFQNEMSPVDEATAQCFIDMYDTLREGGYEGMIVYGSYGPGGPPMDEWGKPHVKAACLKADAIENHEYWDLTIKHYNTWLAHRHVRIMNEYPYLKSKPWFIGEFGSDGVNKGEDPQNRSGWRDRDKLTADEYIKQIEIYRKGDPEEGIPTCTPNMLAVFVFQQGAPPHMWQGWETRGTKLMDYMKSTWKPTVGYIHGKVTDANSKPAEGVTLTLSPGRQRAVTDDQGRYWFFSLNPAQYTVRTAKPGYIGGSVKVPVKAGDYVKKDFTIKAAKS